jgi:hypothetical protein
VLGVSKGTVERDLVTGPNGPSNVDSSAKTGPNGPPAKPVRDEAKELERSVQQDRELRAEHLFYDGKFKAEQLAGGWDLERVRRTVTTNWSAAREKQPRGSE